MFDRAQFERDKRANARAQSQDAALGDLALKFVIDSDQYHYGYQWTWLDMPIVQLPQDILAVQEIIWKCQPDHIIETGIAWGGSVVFYASLLQLIGKGQVVAVDTVLPEQNRREIMKFPFSERITLLEGSSIDPDIVERIKARIQPDETAMVLLDSNHTHEHVLEELHLYAPMVTIGQYLVVSDTIVADIPAQTHRPRPWGPDNNPKTALMEYLKCTDRFMEDEYINNKLLTTYTPNGYLKCIA